jgi:Uma2 family endonuclease
MSNMPILQDELLHKPHQASIVDDMLIPDIDTLITEDDEPVDNVFSAKQQRFLIETLYANTALWNPEAVPFIADANVGVFISPTEPPLVPDAFLSMNIKMPETFDYKKIRSYFVWIFAKTPDIVVEIVSNRKGGEMKRKMTEYAKLHIPFYAVFDPFDVFRGERLQIYKLSGAGYEPLKDFWMEDFGLGLRLWEGEYENMTSEWLRWCDVKGNVLHSGKELSVVEKIQAEQEKMRADAEQARAEQEQARAEQALENAAREKTRAENALGELDAERERSRRLVEKLRALGMSPDDV